MQCTIELTDTFGGEANYSWVQRHSFDIDGLTDSQIERKGRALVGLTGVRTNRQDYGDMIRWDVQGACVCAFLTSDF